MKKLCWSTLVLAAGLGLAACNNAEEEENNNIPGFSDTAQGEELRNAHNSPETVKAPEFDGQMMSFEAKDNKPATAYVVMANNPSRKYLLVFHEGWGLNDNVRQTSDKLAETLGDVNIIALDLYDGQVAKDPGAAEKLTQGTSEKRINNIIAATLDYMGPDAEIGTLGWGYGGGWSLRTAIKAGDRLDACVIYYGMPVNELNQLKKLNGPVLGIFGKKDEVLNPEVVAAFEKNMKKSGESLEVHSYNAAQAFASPGNPGRYNSAAADSAWDVTITFLEKNLMKKPTTVHHH